MTGTRRVTVQRQDVLEAIADQVPVSPEDCTRVGVDGVDGAGKTTFADDLADVLRSRGRRVVRISADDFLHPAAVRHRRGRHDPAGFWLDSYDLPALRRRVLDPLGPGGSRWYRRASHDLTHDTPLDPAPERAASGAVVVVDGLFLHRDELRDAWELSVFLDAPPAVTVARVAARDGSHPDPQHPTQARYVDGQQLYAAAAQPAERADCLVDAADLDAPVLVRAPSPR